MSSANSGEPGPAEGNKPVDPVTQDPFELFRRLDPIIKEQPIEADESKLDEIINMPISGPNILKRFLNRFRRR